MIISHKWKYVFVELPHTGSSAVAKALRTEYDGIGALHKHATYDELLKIATPEIKDYFVFSAVRNPLDRAVTRYFRLKYDHDDVSKQLGRKSLFVRLAYRYKIHRSRLLSESEMEFSDYFMRYYRFPFDDWSALRHHEFDFVMKCEQLQEDFSEVLARIGIPETRSLPVVNTTRDRDPDYTSYFSGKAIDRARWIFGPYMEKWGYEFPASWGPTRSAASARIVLRLVNVFRKVYWRFLRPFVYRKVIRDTGGLMGRLKGIPDRQVK